MGERRRSGALVALSAACVLFGAYFSWRAPCGSWNHSVFGAPKWNEGDPGGYYIPSAHELYSSGGRLLYPGHPGLPLQIVLHAVQALYFLTAAPSSLGFTAFIARRIAVVFFLSKLLMTLLHVLSFWLLLAFARQTLGRDRAALLAVLAYATSLPVLYYLSRISVEPLVSIFFLATFLAAWRCVDERSPRRSIVAAVFCGAFAVSGLATKFHLLWPLPIIGLLSLRTARRTAVSAYIGGAALALILYSRLLNWRDFFAYWDVSGMSGSASAGFGGLLARQLGIFPSIVQGLRRMPSADWLPGRTRSGLFLLCEAAFLALSVYGFLLPRDKYPPPQRLFWPSLAAAYTLLIWLYRAAGVSGDFHDFHYLFVFVLLMSLFFGQAAAAILPKTSPASGGPKEAALTLLLLAAVHAVPLWAVIDSRSRDAEYFSHIRAFPDASSELSAGSHVEVVGSSPFFVVCFFGFVVLCVFLFFCFLFFVFLFICFVCLFVCLFVVVVGVFFFLFSVF